MKFSKAVLGGSLILLLTFNFFNLLNFIYSLAMVRMLSLADYGVLSTLTYFVILFAIFNESIQTVISKYTVQAKGNLSKLKNILLRSIRKGGRVSTVSFIIYLILSVFLSQFLHIQYWLIALTGIALYAAFLVPITRGALQGLRMFQGLGNNMIVEGSVKLVASILLVLLGWRIYGAVTGILLGSLCAFAFSFFQLRNVFGKREKTAKIEGIYSYTAPVFMATLAIILFFSLDIILAKRFFAPEAVGAYAVASTIAKIIFSGTQPISRAMFPIATGAKDGKSARKTLLNSLFLVVAIVVVCLALILIFPDLIVRLFSGKGIVEASNILFTVSIAMGLLSVANLVILYNLARNRLNHAKWLLFPVIIQVAALFAFHSSLTQFSLALAASSVIFLIAAVLFAYTEKDK